MSSGKWRPFCLSLNVLTKMAALVFLSCLVARYLVIYYQWPGGRDTLSIVTLFTINSCRADSRFAPSQWETALLCNDVSHWLGASLESALSWVHTDIGCEQLRSIWYDIIPFTEMKIPSYWWNFHYWLHGKLSFQQCMDKIFCVELQQHPLQFHTKISYPYTWRCILYTEKWDSKSPEPQEFIGVLVDSFTVHLHSPNSRPAVRAVQRDCHWGLKNGKNSHWSCKPIIQWGTRQSQYIFRLTNHKRIMPADWRPCLLPHWQS